ncbi:AMIN domain-containing protein [Helicobacter sp.]|uniref:AMIN domain-containing protein n=1 Tax=Helicobacter sp. TaxID=218 RepID=UPI0025C48807|nr:AMIN domain-containing protein [Helicobacter sp.]MBR2495102.1 AMIN domain-containing protein [Helicobacter sp.]
MNFRRVERGYLGLLCVLVLTSLHARENPFEPVIQPKEDNFIQKNAKDPFRDLDFKLPSTARILKSITITYQNIDGTIGTKTIPIDESIDWHYPLLLTQKGAILNEDVRYWTIKPFQFFTQGSKFYLHTSSAILRSFVLPSPYRIVLDMEKKDETPSGSVQLGVKYFTKASLGVHKDFYRLVITLDGQYPYEISRDGDYYIISVR